MAEITTPAGGAGADLMKPGGFQGQYKPLPDKHNTRLPIADIIANPECQLRDACSPATVAEYSEGLLAGVIFPAVIVFSDGECYWLADGFHRYEAHQSAGLTEINAEIRNGGLRDALLFAAGANADHGLRRTQADRRKAILAVLADPEWRAWSDREIARHTATSDKTVAKVRRELSGAGAEIRTEARKMPSAEIRTDAGLMPSQQLGDSPGGMVGKLVRSLADDVLMSEVRRRGLVVSDG